MRPLPLFLLTFANCIFLLIGHCHAQTPGRVDSLLTGATDIHFIANRGQMVSLEDGTVLKQLLFKVPASNGDLYVTTSGLSYVFYRRKQNPAEKTPGTSAAGRHHQPPKRFPGKEDDLHYEVERVDLTFNHATIDSGNILTTYAATKGKYRSCSGNGTMEDMRLIDKIVIRNIYPHVDWVLYIDRDKGHSQVKQDFILHPGADTRDLVFTYSGNAQWKTDSAGTVSVRSRLGTINEGGLLVREEASGKTLPVQVQRHRNSFSYRFPTPVIHQETTIDPVLFWGTALTSDVTGGANNNDEITGNDVETDQAGNIFVLLTVGGGISFPTLNPGNGAYYQDFASTPAGGMVIMKFTPGGVLLWSTFYTSGAGSAGLAMAVDPSGNLYVVGANELTNLLMEFSNTGQLLWFTTWADFAVSPQRLICDSKGDLYLTGTCEGTELPKTNPGGGAYYEDRQYVLRPFISEFTATHQLTWSTQLDGWDEFVGPTRMAIDQADNLYLMNDSVRCFNTSHQQTWKDATVGYPYLQDITIDRLGNIYVVGFGPETIPMTDPGNGAYIDNYPLQGFSTGFIIQYSPAHQITWSTPFFTEAMTDLYRIVADQRCNAVHLTGVMNWYPSLVPTMDNSCVGGFYYSFTQIVTTTAPIFVTFTSGGQRVYTSLSNFPYNYYDDHLSMVSDPLGNVIYLFGSIWSYDPVPAVMDPGNGAFYQPSTNNIGTSAFLMKWLPSQLSATISVTPPSGCTCVGSASVNINCGTAPYSYSWSTGETTSSVSDLCSGNQSVTVTDANCNEKTFTFVVPPASGSVTNFTALPQTSYCQKNNGTITVSAVTGGTAPYSYSIDKQPPNNTGSFTSLVPGNHLVRVTDVNGCSYADSVMVTETPGPDSLYTTTSEIGRASCRERV